MTKPAKEIKPLDVYPATAERWPDLEALFGHNGAFAGCWCMFWRLNRSEFKTLQSEGRKAAMREMTLKDQAPGLLAYTDGKPVGWCSIGPREEFAALEASRVLKRVDDAPVWSIVCFFVAKAYRGQRVMADLLKAALGYAQEHGANIVEGYPLDLESPKLAGQRLKSFTGYMGIASIFREAGFVEVGRASETQLIMRCVL